MSGDNLLKCRIPLEAANAVSALRPDYAATVPRAVDRRLHTGVEDEWCHLECSYEIAVRLARALMARVNDDETALDVAAACSSGASLLSAALQQYDVERRGMWGS